MSFIPLPTPHVNQEVEVIPSLTRKVHALTKVNHFRTRSLRSEPVACTDEGREKFAISYTNSGY